MKIGIIREGKAPPDKRVPLTPEQCRFVNDNMPGLEVVVQPSEIRCFSDSDYAALGIQLAEDLSGCDAMMGIKEVKEEDLVPGKMYFFFSHTIKKQPYNRNLLAEVVRKGIQLVDYEVLTDKNGMRIIGFGRFAGLVGAYNGFRAYGLRNRLFDLKPAYLCRDMEEMDTELAVVHLPPVRIAVTGGGRVAGGVCELLDRAGVKQLSVEQYLAGAKADRPVYVQLNPADYNRHRLGLTFDQLHFYNYPAEYQGTFDQYLSCTDILIGAAYWDPRAPVLFTLEDVKSSDFRISVIADITCDIDGSIPTTRRSSTIDDPFYDYDPVTGELREPFSHTDHITVMAVDNLPCELPRDASLDFGKNLIDKVLPCLADDSPGGMIMRASITKGGSLTERFSYLQDYLQGKE